MLRGNGFYGVWDEDNKIWSTDEFDVARLVDNELFKFKDGKEKAMVQTLSDFSSGKWTEYRNYAKNQPDSYRALDDKITFINTDIKKDDYVSKRLNYALEEGPMDSYDELINTLYKPRERAKLEWAIGSIIDGDSKRIQKFIVLYGTAGSGKSTVLNIIQKLFHDYYTTFDAKALGSNNNTFATEVFKNNPLIAIQHDGDLSKMEDNTKLNSIVSHEEMPMNEKYKSSYTAKTNCFLFMGTNEPVSITNSKSGIIRRLIDVNPSGDHLLPSRYQMLVNKIDFELGAIAFHCLATYRKMGKNYYSDYKPTEMILQTNVFFNFVEENYLQFKNEGGVSLRAAYSLYKEYCDESLITFKLPMHKFREELKSYFNHFDEQTRVNGVQVRSYYSGFEAIKFTSIQEEIVDNPPPSMTLDFNESLFDKEFNKCQAQYATTVSEAPILAWDEVKTKLSDLDTSKIHYVRVPKNHIVIDFDLKDEKGNKSLERNLDAASIWPSTYAELSKGENGIHLHYIYDGDASTLSRVFDNDIEIKVFAGKSSLRRKLTKCNNIPIANMGEGILPLKGEKMINFNAVKNENGIRTMIKRNLNKEIHSGTKSSIDFINKILDDAYASGVTYDVSDMKGQILAFGNNSTNQAMYCIKLVPKMKFQSEEKDNEEVSGEGSYTKNELVFFDVEVFPNLFVIVWKVKGKPCVKMINPSSADVEALINMKLVGFNCRRYDNHILYGRLIGYDNRKLYELSQKIINNSRSGLFGEAYNISYTDVYDFASAGNKQSLKKFEIQLGIHHQELGLPWDKDVSEELWEKVAEYCCNDVEATEATFDFLDEDFTARLILAELSGLTPNDTTNMHSTKIMFGNNKHPQSEFIYTDLSKTFPGYKFEFGKSTYRGEEVGEGGYVYSEPGTYGNVPVLDIASMHPTTVEELMLFGPYTKVFSDIKAARLAIKHHDYNAAKKMLDGKLAKFLTDNNKADGLSNALKTVINSIYGLTSAKFENAFRDPRNVDNIVAKRGALFMIDLKHAVQDEGFVVAHIKTDSIKIPDATPEIIQFVIDYGKKYGYDFEHEATYDKITLVNDAVYIAKYDKYGLRSKGGKYANEWTATGTQFKQPYVYKTLFTKEPIEFGDMCETKAVITSLYLDMNESLPDVTEYEKKKDNIWKKLLSKDQIPDIQVQSMEDNLVVLDIEIARGHDYHFIGKVGGFCPIKPGCGGGLLMREKDGKYYAATGSKGYRWLESEMVKTLHKEKDIDQSFYASMCDEAIDAISKYCDFEWFRSDDPYVNGDLKRTESLPISDEGDDNGYSTDIPF